MKFRAGKIEAGKAGTWLCLLLLLLMAAPVCKVFAASVTITFSVDEEEIRVGDEVELTMTLTSDAVMGDFEAYLSYDSTVMEFTFAPACINGSDGLLQVRDEGASASTGERTYKIRFLAVAQGECEIGFYKRPVVYGYTDGVEMSVTGVGKTLKILPAFGASADSSLATLRIVDGIKQIVPLMPEFSPEVTLYFAAVPYETEYLVFSALAQDSRATVEIEGASELKTGDNTVQIIVTAEDGTYSEYTIYVYRALMTEVTPVPSPEPTPAMPEKGAVLSDGEGVVLLTEYHTYTVCDWDTALEVPAGYRQTYLLLNGISIPAYTKEEGTAEFLLLMLQEETGNAAWYSYDRIGQTIQRINEERFVIERIVVSDEDELKETVGQYQQKQAFLLLVVSVLSGLSVLLLLVILWLCLRKKWSGKAKA